MSPDSVIELCQSTILQAITLGGPLVGCAFAVSLLLGLLQALTQVQDQSLTFVPKLIALALVFVMLLPWGLDLLADFAVDLIRGIPNAI